MVKRSRPRPRRIKGHEELESCTCACRRLEVEHSVPIIYAEIMLPNSSSSSIHSVLTV